MLNVQTRIIDGNIGVANGAIHVVDRPLMQYINPDITTVLDKYSSSNANGLPSIRLNSIKFPKYFLLINSLSLAFSTFYNVLKSTGVYNDLKILTKQFTVFIPTNDALSKFQSIVNSNDATLIQQVCYFLFFTFIWFL